MITQGLVREWSGQHRVGTFSTQRTSRFGVFVVIFFFSLFIFNSEKEKQKKKKKKCKASKRVG
jgi:hypothetical protein